MGKKKIVTLIMVIAVGCIGVHACFLDAAAQAKNRVFSENEERIVKASYPDVSAAEPEEQPQELSAVEPSQVMAKDMADKEAEEDGETDADEKEDRIYSVTFPAEIHAYLDPGNISGRGQIFSDVYTIENYSNRDVAVKIKNIDVHYRFRTELYELSADKVTEKRSKVKKLNINMIWENEAKNAERAVNVSEGIVDEYVLFLDAAEYDEKGEFVKLNAGSKGSLYFTGTLSRNPDINWSKGELTTDFSYEITDTENMEE